MKPDDQVNLKAFARCLGCNYSALSRLFLLGNKIDGSPDAPRYFSRLELPKPIGGDYLAKNKRWWGRDVMAFKKRLDEEI